MRTLIICVASLLTFCLVCDRASARPPAKQDTDVVCIDPGHPSEVNSGYTVQNGLTETHIDWVVAQRLRQILTRDGIKVVMTRSQERRLVTNRKRAEIANGAHATLLIRLHCDASPGSGYALYYPDRKGKAHGVTGPSDRVIIESKHAAELLHVGVSSSLQRKLKDCGIKGDSSTLIGSRQGALTGSIFSLVPVVTIEMVVLSNKSDARFIGERAGQNAMAEALAKGIHEFLDKHNVEPDP